MPKTEFWLVWCEEAQSPKVRHQSALEAGVEAERLARKNPGQRFYILRCREYVTFNPAPVQWTKLDELPF